MYKGKQRKRPNFSMYCFAFIYFGGGIWGHTGVYDMCIAY